MCGIAGKITFGNKIVAQSELKKMSLAIEHRGPDDEGFYISENKRVGFVNRRLAIIDLSKNGHMPMSYMNRYVITYNGEFYSFQGEREKLKKDGYKFHSSGDTEVIMALYDKYGVSCLSHMRGMFAFALHDLKKGTIFFARDRVGKKPLKYFQSANELIFASELKAILTQSEVKRIPDFEAIHTYLTYGYVPSPDTGFVGIKKLEPGHYMILNLKTGSLTNKKYWEPDLSQKLDLSETEWCSRIVETLTESTRLRMISDVPIGAFLSGGVDSSAVVASMAKLSARPVKTFTIGFKEKKYNETEHANRVAKLYKTDHTELIVEPKSVELLPTLAHQYEEPFADSSSVITYMVSQMARKHVTVILNGDGGDENFAGYERHKKIVRDIVVDQIPLKRAGALTLRGVEKISKSQKITRARKFLEKSSIPLSDRYVSYNRYLDAADKERIYSEAFFDKVGKLNALDFARHKFKESGVSGEDQGLYFDLTAYLPEDLLAKVDIASMAVSLEGRSPILDHHMVELAASIPYGLKVKGGETKYIFKKALEGLVPDENLYRQKMGFSVPLENWFSGPLNKYAASKLLRKNAMTADMFDQGELKKMLDNHRIGNDFGPPLWALLTLELWMESYFS